MNVQIQYFPKVYVSFTGLNYMEKRLVRLVRKAKRIKRKKRIFWKETRNSIYLFGKKGNISVTNAEYFYPMNLQIFSSITYFRKVLTKILDIFLIT